MISIHLKVLNTQALYKKLNELLLFLKEGLNKRTFYCILFPPTPEFYLWTSYDKMSQRKKTFCDLLFIPVDMKYKNSEYLVQYQI